MSLFVFPAVTGTTASKDSTCPTSNPTIVAYTFPDPPSNTTLPTADTYEVVGFKNNYKTTDAATSLNQAAPIVIAAGDSGQSNCTGIKAPGGEGTYYAQVIYAAQTALLAQQAANPGSQNAIILLTDGDATACASNANTTAGACNSSSQLVASEGTLNGTGTHTSNPTGYQSYAYPSALGSAARRCWRHKLRRMPGRRCTRSVTARRRREDACRTRPTAPRWGPMGGAGDRVNSPARH